MEKIPVLITIRGTGTLVECKDGLPMIPRIGEDIFRGGRRYVVKHVCYILYENELAKIIIDTEYA